MIVTIDGPAGAGKSSAARRLAGRLGFRFLDTGAMYRAVTLAACQRNIDLQDGAALEQLARSVQIKVLDDRVLLDDRDVTDTIRTFEITSLTHYAADHPGVREKLVELQRACTAGEDTVTEGRDQATVVFPDAECKIFLTASEDVRAQRRFHDLLSRREDVTFEEVLAKQRIRDAGDLSRKKGGLRKAEDSIEVVTDGLSPEEVVDKLEQIVQKRQ